MFLYIADYNIFPGLPRLTGTFAFSMLMANAAIGALIMHVIVFWGGDIVRTIKNARKGKYNDPHHEHMALHYKDAPWWWFAVVLVVSFILGIVVVTTQNVTLPVWAYVFSLILGSIITPFVSWSQRQSGRHALERQFTNIGQTEQYPICQIWKRHCYQ